MSTNIYIEYNANNEITFIHYRPFCEKFGLNKSYDELLQTGVFVDYIEDVKIENLIYDVENNSVKCINDDN